MLSILREEESLVSARVQERYSRCIRTWLIALGIMLLQLAIAVSLCKTAHLGSAYVQLCQWDSEWYCDIAERGYTSYIPVPPPGNAKDNGGFFPGYPLSARVLHVFLGLDSQLALLAVAQGAAVVFWAGFLLLLNGWRIRPPYQALAVLAVLCHPCSFYLVAGYAESLFCAALVFFVYFSLSRSPGAPLGMAVSGFVVIATRITGVPVTGLPILYWLFRKRPQLREALAIGVVSSLGVVIFFLYCRFHFGDFLHYMNTQKEGWGVVPDYLAVFRSENYVSLENGDRISMSLTALALILTIEIEITVSVLENIEAPRSRKNKLWILRLPLYVGVLAFWYLSSSGVAAVSFRSLIRYSLPWTVLLIIAWTHLFSFSLRLPRIGKAVIFTVLAIAMGIAFSRCTLEMLNTYLHGGWVS